MNQQLDKKETKREKISRANSTVFIAVAVAAVVVMASLIAAKFLWAQLSYNSRVISAKVEARNQIKKNNSSVDSLSKEFVDLEASASTNSKVILHALPPSYDYPGLATYIESLAQTSGVTFPGSVGQDISESAIRTSVVSEPQEIPLSIEVNGTYDSIVQFIKNTELSIRPIHITSVEYSGTSDKLKALITATTYYQPTRDLGVGKMEVQ
ncbi:type 4a pilus biogenesis protein PilO [Candidatus Saccharibacteria bacterium]|nr:type 4a pilus biogenesis protein PilO [Candidatus Saccharibacteria bacterium]